MVRRGGVLSCHGGNLNHHGGNLDFHSGISSLPTQPPDTLLICKKYLLIYIYIYIYSRSTALAAPISMYIHTHAFFSTSGWLVPVASAASII